MRSFEEPEPEPPERLPAVPAPRLAFDGLLAAPPPGDASPEGLGVASASLSGASLAGVLHPPLP